MSSPASCRKASAKASAAISSWSTSPAPPRRSAPRYVARARPDGATLLVGSNSALSQAPFAYRNLGYDPLADFTHISLLYASAYLLVAHPRWGSFAQVIEAAKREPGKLSYATWGVGSTAHMLMLDLCERTGVEMLHVPFGGPAPALTEILAGRVDMMFTTFAPARGHVLEGRLNALGAPHEQRLAAVPQVPTMGELGLPEFLVSAWWCLAGPAGLPPPLAAALEQAVRAAVARPQAQRLAEEFGLLPLPLGPQAMRARITPRPRAERGADAEGGDHAGIGRAACPIPCAASSCAAAPARPCS